MDVDKFHFKRQTKSIDHSAIWHGKCCHSKLFPSGRKKSGADESTDIDNLNLHLFNVLGAHHNTKLYEGLEYSSDENQIYVHTCHLYGYGRELLVQVHA